MKRFLVILFVFVLLFTFSSCKRTPTYEEMYDSLLEENSVLEEKYYDAAERVYEFDSLLNEINENYATAYCYYDDADPDVTEEEAYNALMKIGELLREAGY